MFPPCPLPADLPALAAPLAETPRPPPGAAKPSRDAWGAWPHERSSANFVVKWGEEGGVDDADADAFLALFEAAWAVEIGTLGHAPPTGADAWRFNVYLGDTGDGTPPTRGYAGYYTLDPDGWPMVVMNPDALALGYAAGTSAHEFYHGVQHATGAYLDDPLAGWWWEATAMWVEGEVWPDDPDEASFLFGFGLAPQLPLWTDVPFSEGTLAEYHAYGAFVFPRYLAEVAADPALVVATWTDPGGATTPQAALAARLDFWGTYAAFVARNARWDYADGALYAANLDRYRDTFAGDPDLGEVGARVTGTTEAALEVAGGGYTQVDLVGAGEARWTIGVAGEVPLAATLVRDTPEGLVYLPFGDIDGGVGAAFDGIPGEGVARLVVAVTDPAPGPFPLALSVTAAPLPVDDTGPTDTATSTDPAPACGCATAPPSPAAGLLVLLTLRAARRRVPPPTSARTG